jgi:hypothetical protein
METEKQQFLTVLQDALTRGIFVKCTLGKYRGDEDLQRLIVTLVQIAGETRLNFRYQYKRNETHFNYDFVHGMGVISRQLGGEFYYGGIFSTEKDFTIEYSRKGVPRVHTLKASTKTVHVADHNREKKRFVDQRAPYLHILGITDARGEVLKTRYDKFRQIDKFVEIVASLIRNSSLNDHKEITVADLGSGKSYLTFALYDYLQRELEKSATMRGFESREELANLSNDNARACAFEALTFVAGAIAEADLKDIDIIVALHACDTATDDTILKAIEANAEIIVLAPCCHKYLRPQLRIPEVFKPIFKHGILEERFAVTMTDGLRALFLEAHGYRTKVFEFISSEHTDKNTMITAVRGGGKSSEATQRIDALKQEFGLEDFYLDI